MLVSILLSFYLHFLTPYVQAESINTSTSNNSQRGFYQTTVPRQLPPNRNAPNGSNLARLLQKGMWDCFTLTADSKVLHLKIKIPNHQSTGINQQTPSEQPDVAEDQTHLHSKISKQYSIFKLLNQQKNVASYLAEIIEFLNKLADTKEKIHCKCEHNIDPKYQERKEKIDKSFNYFSKRIVRYHTVINYFSKSTYISKGLIEKFTREMLNFYTVIIALENFVNMTLEYLRMCERYFPIDDFNTYIKSIMTFKLFLATKDRILFDFNQVITQVRVEYGFSINLIASNDNTDNNSATNQTNTPLNEAISITDQETTSNSSPSK